jgi:hypothetical protein
VRIGFLFYVMFNDAAICLGHLASVIDGYDVWIERYGQDQTEVLVHKQITEKIIENNKLQFT